MMKRFYCLFAGLFLTLATFAQDGNKFLLLTKEMEFEATDAINNMYNFKFDLAHQQFEKIKQRHIDHPGPYFLMAMNNWWRMMPYNSDDPSIKKYEKLMLAYLDSSITKADEYYKIDSVQIESAFFLSAAYGLKARYYAERGDKVGAVMPAKHALKYFKRTDDNNALSPEFLFGSALFNYYGEWFRDEYPMLKPMLVIFPKGSRELGLLQMEKVANSAFYTRTEAQYFLMRIYYQEEDTVELALPVVKKLWEDFPDNAYFERMYARFTWQQGWWTTCEKLSEDIVYKHSIRLPGYEENSLRYAYFFLGYINSHTYHNYDKAREYYIRSILLAEKTNATHMSYYLTAVYELGMISKMEKDYNSAKQYFNTVLDRAGKKDNENINYYLNSLFELGLIYKLEKNNSSARKYFNDVINNTQEQIDELSKKPNTNKWKIKTLKDLNEKAKKELEGIKATRNKLQKRGKK